MAKAGYTGEQPVRVAREESYPGAWTSPEQYTERKANTWSLSPVYEIERSLRFNSADSAYLSRTPTSAGNRKTWTWAGWVKRSGTTTDWLPLFQVYDGSSLSESNFLQLTIYLDQIGIATNTTWLRRTQAVYRDYSAWMHVVCAFDTTQATGSDRVKIYVNGSQVTAFAASSDPTQNTDYGINRAVSHQIGQRYGGQYFNGYLADVYLIDGSALDPTSFGKFDDNGVWQPKAYTGSYPGNSFHLDFADNSSVAALGYDAAGSNDWAVNNISLGGTLLYSSYLTSSTGSFYANRGPEKGFDGLAGTLTGCSALGSSPIGTNYLQYTPPSPISVASSINFLMWDSDHQQQISINGGAYQVIPASTSPSVSFTGTVTSIRISSIDGGRNAGAFSGLGFDGIILIDGPRNDSLRDSPTNGSQTDTGVGGEVIGNYATFNPLNAQIGAGSIGNGNLDFIGPSGSAAYNFIGGTFGIDTSTNTGWYFEFTQTSYGEFASVSLLDQSFSASSLNISQPIGRGASPGISYRNDGYIFNYGTETSGLTTWQANGDIISIAIKDNKIWFAKNGVWISGSPSAGTSPSVTLASAKYVTPAASGINLSVLSLNAGQRPFAYTAPSGFKALCTTNLPAPVVAKPSEVMDVKLYTGNGSTQTISGLGFSPDLVWIKGRDFNSHHRLYDQIRLATNSLRSSSTDAEGVESTGLTAFTSDGFTLGSDPGHNNAGQAMVAWTWDAGSSTATNNSGSISSQVRANISAGFSVVSYTGNYSNATVGHGLGVAPQMIIVKDRTAGYNWQVYHYSIGNGNGLLLNTTDAAQPLSSWNNTSPTSSVFSLGAVLGVNNSTAHIAYCFAPVAGYSAFGSYTGNGSTDGPFVYTGFRPRFILTKATNSAFDWNIFDAARDPYNSVNKVLFPNLSSAESDYIAYTPFDFLSNGFKLRTNIVWNASSTTYIYAAFAENPFQYARAR